MSTQRWQRVWREGLLPQFSIQGLRALAQALMRDDHRLLQGITVSPPALEIFADAPIEAACALGYCAWKGEGMNTVGELVARYEEICLAAEEALGEAGGSRFFLDWFDQTPWSLMRRQMLAEIRSSLAQTDLACTLAGCALSP